MYLYDTKYPRDFGPRKDKLVEYKALEVCADLLILSRFTYKIYHRELILVGKTTLFIRSLKKISEGIYLSYFVLLYRMPVM